MKKLFLVFVAVIGLTITFFVVESGENKKAPMTLGSSYLYLEKSIDDKIKEAELIVIGQVITNLPSQWNGPNGRNDSQKASPEEILQARGLFTDSIISIDRILKGDIVEPIVRVRSFIGKTEKVQWVNNSQPSFEKKQTYLLFLEKDTGATAKVNPGDYVSVNANMAVYEIVDGQAISADDEWALEELIAYIEEYLSNKK